MTSEGGAPTIEPDNNQPFFDSCRLHQLRQLDPVRGWYRDERALAEQFWQQEATDHAGHYAEVRCRVGDCAMITMIKKIPTGIVRLEDEIILRERCFQAEGK